MRKAFLHFIYFINRILFCLLLVWISMAFTFFIFQLANAVKGHSFSIDELTYAVIVGSVTFVLPFFSFFLIYWFTRDKLSSKTNFFLKLPGQLLLGLVLAIVCLLFLNVITFIVPTLSWASVQNYSTGYIFFLIFVVIVIVLNYCYELYDKVHQIDKK